MDLWVVAAAAGAGYIAKNLQNLSVDKKESQIGPCYKYSPNIQPEAGSPNFLQQLREITCPLLLRLARNDDIADVDVSEVHRSSDRADDDSEDYNMGLLVSSLPKEESLYFSQDAPNRNIRRANISTIEPLLVTDTTRGIYTSGSNSSFSEFDEENGVRLKQIEKLRKSKECSESSQGPGTMLLLITGMTVGILSATMSWKTEVDKLNKQLKQMQSLAKDLHEELDMKEMIMVKELSTEGDAAENESVQEPISSPSGVEANDDKPGEIDSIYTENLELLSKIEAELQAELEMLENNMNLSSLERISSVVELDRDFEPDIAQGELKATTVEGVFDDSGNETTEDDETATNRSQPAANYAVSPWELSLRLHDLIESRLQNRVYELETALANISSYSSPNESKYSDAESLP